MTKQFLLTICLMVGSQMAYATTSMNCIDGKGRELNVKINDVETVIPYYDVVFKFNGKVVEKFEVLQMEDSPERFMAQTQNDDSGIIKTVGYIHSIKQGFYQHAANDGMSPLPSLMFDKCKIK